jgi:hypothetical protein
LCKKKLREKKEMQSRSGFTQKLLPKWCPGLLVLLLMLWTFPRSVDGFSTLPVKVVVNRGLQVKQHGLFQYQPIALATSSSLAARRRLWLASSQAQDAAPGGDLSKQSIPEEVKNKVVQALEGKDDLSVISYVADFYKDSFVKQRIGTLENTVQQLLERIDALERKQNESAAVQARSPPQPAIQQQQQVQQQQQQARNAWQQYLQSTLGTPPLRAPASTPAQQQQQQQQQQRSYHDEYAADSGEDDEYDDEYSPDEFSDGYDDEEYDEDYSDQDEYSDDDSYDNDYDYDEEEDPYSSSASSVSDQQQQQQQQPQPPRREVDPFAADYRPTQVSSTSQKQEVAVTRSRSSPSPPSQQRSDFEPRWLPGSR